MAKNSRWDRFLAAPDAAISFYKAMDHAHRTGAFTVCHIFDGRPPICLSLKGPQICSTPGCINPKHWSNQRVTKEKKKRFTVRPPTAPEMLELLEFYLDRPPYPKRNFESLRAVIPKEDLTDGQLKQLLETH